MCDCFFLTARNPMTTHTTRMLKVIIIIHVHPLSAINTEKRVLPTSKSKELLGACDEVFVIQTVLSVVVFEGGQSVEWS